MTDNGLPMATGAPNLRWTIFDNGAIALKTGGGKSMSKLAELEKLGQSVWFDFIRRSLITSGELKALIDKGVRGITSNPAIFE